MTLAAPALAVPSYPTNELTQRRSVAHRAHDIQLRWLAKESLKYPAVTLSGVQARAVARGIGAIVPKVRLAIHACAIMPDHVHVVVAAHRFDGDELVACVKRAGTRGLNDERLNPMQEHAKADGRLPSPWGGRGWKLMLFTSEQMASAIRYVDENPVRARSKRQSWSFIARFVG